MDYTQTAIFSDLDGTLFDSHGLVSEKNREAILDYTARGGLFAIATGRSYLNAKKYLPGVQINAPCIVFNGAGVYDPKLQDYPYAVHVDHEAVEKVLFWCREHLPMIDTQVYGERMTYYVTPEETATKELVRQLLPNEFTTIEEILPFPWFKTLHYGQPDEMRALEQFLKESGVDQRVAIVRAITEIPPYHEHIELLPKNLNKGSALHFCRMLPIYAGRQMIGIGDYKNDIELLEAADIAGCPENACDEIKNLSNHVLPSNNDDAIASLIYDCIPSISI